MDEVVWATSVDGRQVLFLNLAAEKLYGRKNEELLESSDWWMMMVHPSDREFMQDFFAQVLDKGMVSSEHRILRPDNLVRWVRTRGKVIRNADGQAVRVDGLVTDITEQKLSEQELSKQKQLLGKIIDTLPLSIFIKDINSRFLMINTHCASNFGKIKHELIGKSMFDLYPEEIAKKLCLQDKKILNSGETAVHEEKMIRDGREYNYVLSGKTLLDVEGELPMLLGYAIDVTERKQMEEALRQTRDELEERVMERTAELSTANAQLKALTLHLQHVREEERSRVAREIHDELGGVLASVKFELSTPIEQENFNADALARRYQATAQIVDAAIYSLRRIMADLRPSVLDDIGLWAALEWQVQDFEERLGVPCIFQLEGTEINVSPALATALFRMVQGALNNVAKHANATDVLVVASVSSDAITITVEDNGIGISDGQLQETTALGLLGRQELARALGGSVEVYRNAIGGTTVEIKLPRLPS